MNEGSIFVTSKKNFMKKVAIIAIVFSFVLINACKKEEEKEKSFLLEMKIDGVLWTATKNQTGLYTPSSGKLSLTGQGTGDEIINLNRDSVNLNGTYAMPTGTITVNHIKGGTLRIYSLSASQPRTRGSLTLKTINESRIPNVKYPEVDFSAVLFDGFNVDSIIVTEGKLRYQ